MRRARIFERECMMQGSPWTLVEYSRAFGSDFISDFVESLKKDPIELVDYLQYAWALCKTADASILDFEEWCKEFDEFTLDGGEGQAFVRVIDSAVIAEMFCPKKTGFAKWSQKLRARWMGWLQRRRKSY